MSRVAVFSSPYLRGLGAGTPLCLDQNQNTVNCQDPECTYGDCGAVSSYVPTGACLDQHQNQVLCTDPECTYGDCLGPSTPAPRPPSTVLTPGGIVSRPSPVLNVPLSTSSIGMWITGSTLISGLPNVAVLGIGAIALAVLFGSGKKGRR